MTIRDNSPYSKKSNNYTLDKLTCHVAEMKCHIKKEGKHSDTSCSLKKKKMVQSDDLKGNTQTWRVRVHLPYQ